MRSVDAPECWWKTALVDSLQWFHTYVSIPFSHVISAAQKGAMLHATLYHYMRTSESDPSNWLLQAVLNDGFAIKRRCEQRKSQGDRIANNQRTNARGIM
jgi:hypothetical protein